MTGHQLAKAIRNAKGKISVPVLTPNDAPYIYVEKGDLIRWAEGCGDVETEMCLGLEQCGWYLKQMY